MQTTSLHAATRYAEPRLVESTSRWGAIASKVGFNGQRLDQRAPGKGVLMR